MKQSITISKSQKSEKSQDYAFLRDEGLKFIQELSGDLWTDHNIHDPGITILEVLCYAITELGYKTAFEIKDLLAEKYIHEEEDESHFLTARKILTSHPITILDFRKLLIDVPGVKNAWLKIAHKSSPEIWLDCKKSELVYRSQIPFLPDGKPAVKAEKLNIGGFYNVRIELDNHMKFGDLNKFDFEISLAKIRTSFTIQVTLPACGFYFGHIFSTAHILGFTITDVKQVAEKTFKASLAIKLKGKILFQEIKIQSSIKITNAVTELVRAELEKQSDGCLCWNYKEKLIYSLAIQYLVDAKLQEYRNLCEDFFPAEIVSIEDIVVCADIQLEPAFDNEKVMAEILYQLEQFIAPPVNFYTYNELIKKGKRTESIFEGPAMEHGFIDEDELQKSEPRKAILVSDLINIIMDIEGVVAVKRLVLSSYSNGNLLNNEEHWCLNVQPGLMPKLDLTNSKIVFFKENLPYFPNKSEVKEYLNELYDLQRKQKLLKTDEFDLKVPEGTYRNVSEYFTIQNEFPLTYGVGDKGIPGVITNKRIAQAKQLKGYLLFFDQLLANYLAQLSNIQALFSINKKIDKTYFYKVLYNLPAEFSFNPGSKSGSVLFNDKQLPLIYCLVKDFTDTLDLDSTTAISLDSYSSFKADWIEYKKETGLEVSKSTHYVKSIDSIVESEQVFLKRRNIFLDHLLARFGEQFSDYLMLTYGLDKKQGQKELINDKIAFLEDYQVLSSERGRAFNYKNTNEVWDTENVAGLKKRVYRILGIDDYTRHNLVCKNINELFLIFKDIKGEWRFHLKDNKGKILLRSESYKTKQNCQKGIQSVIKNGKNIRAYSFIKAKDNTYYFNIVARNGEIVAISQFYKTIKKRETIIQLLIELFNQKCDQEGFYVVEHLLLNPLVEGDKLMNVCIAADCQSCTGNKDPYSFRISILVPSWPKRFQSMEFRSFFEKTIRMEAPAHIHLRICWLNREDMKQFETKYKNWLIEKAKSNISLNTYSQKLSDLLEAMNHIRSVYPQSNLFDCSNPVTDENTKRIILNNTILGTFKPKKNGNNK